MITAEQAVEHATRLLEKAEMELTNIKLMERYDELACSWLTVAHLLMEKERL
ncbi:hypothetical protein [Streptomyces sp. PR69]|uniref:hypothetical protein n=1 Tax=Streptomyces sp. PR69 TaxID=2984950 RepID=UPI0022652417|nr:hypothetical protein [Streptomyces sp. PR69]